MVRAVVLVDGEHYPPVTAQAIATLTRFEIIAAVFAGGGEKLSRPIELGVPLVRAATADEAVREAIATYAPDVVFELSDDPVVDHTTRMRLAAIALAHDVSYEAPGFRLDPPPRPLRANVPSIAIIGSGKRCGKTAVSAYVARTLAGNGMRPVIVAMGRGGPERPVVVVEPPDAVRLLAIADSGEHAASDVYEDAVIAGVPVVGARRAGAGPNGQTAFDTVAAAMNAAEGLEPDLILFEGSGTAIPPVRTDATILVVREEDDPGVWPIAHRILLADLVMVRMRSDQASQTQAQTKFSALTSPNRDPVPVASVAFDPTPTKPVEGRKIYVTTTAPEKSGIALRAHLEGAHGAQVVGISHHLSDRARLEEDLSAAVGKYDVLVCELKAAAVDVAVRRSLAAGAEVVFLDNRPRGAGLETHITFVARKAKEKFAAR